MKRIFALVLALVLCFVLVACAAETANTESKYAELEKMLDEGRYGDAITYILSLQAGNSSVPLFIAQPGDGTYSDSDLDADEEPTAEVLVLIDELMGEWVCVKDDEDSPQKFAFREDGTCAVDGTEMTWKREATSIPDGNADFRLLSVWEGETERYQIYRPSKSDTSEIFFFVGIVEENTTRVLYNNYICPTNYEVVELTMDNWQEYFEFSEKPYHNTNDFGDITEVGRYHYFTLKEAYYDCLSSQYTSKGSVEIEYTRFNYHARMNEDGTAYTVGEFYREDIGYQTTVLTLTGHSYTEPPYFGTSYGWESAYGYEHYGVPAPNEACVCSHVDDSGVLRIQGTLYLLKEQ